MDTLFIIDDAVALLEVMKNILEHKVYTVKILNNATGIYKEIEDGRKICKDIKIISKLKHIYRLVFSASPNTPEDFVVQSLQLAVCSR